MMEFWKFFFKIKKQSLKSVINTLVILLLLLLSPGPWFYASADEPVTDTNLQLVDGLSQILNKSLSAELKSLEKNKSRLEREEQDQIYLTAAYNAYRLQLSSFWNLLLNNDTELSTLQKTKAELKSSMGDAQNMVDGLIPAENTLKQELENLEKQKQLVDKQLTELAEMNADAQAHPDTRAIEATARQLAGILKEKEELVSRLDVIYKGRLEKMGEIQQAFSALDTRLSDIIEQKKTRNLFERQKKSSRYEAFDRIIVEARNLAKMVRQVTAPTFWIEGGQKLWQGAGLVAASFILVFAVVLIVLRRIKSEALVLRSIPVVEKLGPWHQMAADLLVLSIIPGGLAMTVFLYSRLDKMSLVAGTFSSLSLMVLICLASRWLNQALSTVAGPVAGDETDARRLIRLCRAGACFILVCIVLGAALGQDSALLALFRVSGALCAMVWAMMTWGSFHSSQVGQAMEKGEKALLLKRLATKYVVLTIAGGALFLDMTGYGLLSSHWLVSWAQTLLLFFWWAIFYWLLHEWDGYFREQSRSRKEDFLYDDYPVQWLTIRAGQFCWLLSLGALFLLTWGNPQTILGSLYRGLAHPISIGSMQFSLLGMILAGFVLIFTSVLIRMWKWIFQSKFLSRSGMALGLQESITTISVYLIWAFGVLVALHVFGLNTASLAVAFGALGIGIGFGLQNIVNNFISGIILLFERPIQVGDDVEVNGIWAQVKKINVRSTVVQTYDNAALIIPNADLISNQVTNWSFKDKRIRRKINVGVAYGSDIDLVRDTLLQIAADAPNVLRYPRPDVLFTDFGDSALNFVLRLWTDVDHMLVVDTDIRFRIDKKFRENNIEISFPQRDIHIRSIKGADRFFKKSAGDIDIPE